MCTKVYSFEHKNGQLIHGIVKFGQGFGPLGEIERVLYAVYSAGFSVLATLQPAW